MLKFIYYPLLLCFKLNPQNVQEAFVAKKDVLNGQFIATENNGDGFFFTAALLFCFFFLIICFFIPSDKVAAIGIGLGLLMITVVGFVFAFIMKNFALAGLFPFGIFGVIIVYATIFPPKGNSTPNSRLVIVRDIIYVNEETISPIALLVIKLDHDNEEYFSYIDDCLRFHIGEKCQLDMELITDVSQTRVLRGIMTTDISYIPMESFLPLSPMVEKIFNSVN